MNRKIGELIIDEYTYQPLSRGKKNYLRHTQAYKDRAKVSYLKNREKLLERSRLWRLAHPEKVKEYNVKHYWNKKETIKTV